MGEESAEGVEERIRKVAAARDTARAEAAELRAKVATLEGELAPLRLVATKYEAESKAWAAERTFLEVGVVDPEARELAAWAHGRIPEAERPELGAWLKTIKADPSKAPRALQPYFAPANAAATNNAANTPAVGAGGASGGATASNATANPAPVTRPLETAPAAGGAVTAEAIRAAAAEASRTGNWATYDALKARVLT